LSHFEARGLTRPVVWAIMEAGGLSGPGPRLQEALEAASPVAILRAAAAASAAAAAAAASASAQATAEGGDAAAPQPPPAPSAASLLPRVTLCHGTADSSAPPGQSRALAAALRAAGATRVEERYYEGKSHTDPFLEDPILGGADALLEDILALAHGREGGGVAGGAAWPRFRRMLPAPIVRLARRCTPF